MRAPRVSIGVPTWNGAAWLGATLETALGQSFGDLEVLIADDGSEDSTLDVVAGFRDPRIRVLRTTGRRLGIPGNWNRCLAPARGEYLRLLCQDDLLAPGSTERLVSALDAAADSPLAFSRREIRHEAGEAPLPLLGDTYDRVLAGFYASFTARLSGLDLLRGVLQRRQDPTVNLIGEPSFVLLRTAAFVKSGGFDPRLRQLVDWDLWLRLARLGPLAFVDESLGVFRVHAGGASALHHRSLRTRREFLQILRSLRREYSSRLTPGERRQLGREEWRCRRHLLGGMLGVS